MLDGYYPKKITTTKAEDVVITTDRTTLGRLMVITENISVVIKNGDTEAWPALTGIAEDEFFNVPIILTAGLTLGFSGAGTAYILYKKTGGR